MHEIRSIAGGSDVYSCCHNICDMLASVSHVLCVRLPSGEWMNTIRTIKKQKQSGKMCYLPCGKALNITIFVQCIGIYLSSLFFTVSFFSIIFPFVWILFLDCFCVCRSAAYNVIKQLSAPFSRILLAGHVE